MNHQKILILDFGSQVTQLIARRVREARVYCEIHPGDVPSDFIRGYGAQGIILSGSHASAYDADSLKAPPFVFEAGTAATVNSLVCGLALILLSRRRGAIRQQYGGWTRLIV